MSREEFFGTHVASRRIGEYSLSLRDYAAETTLPRHTHGAPFATVIVDGGFRELSGGTSLDCARHNIVVHAAGEQHVDQFVAPTRCLTVQGGSFTRGALLASASTSSIALKLLCEFRKPDALSAMVIEAVMLELFVSSERDREARSVPPWLRTVRTTIEQRFPEPLTLADLAQSVDVNPAHLARAFRRHYQGTVGEVLRDVRVRYAMQRLASNATLQEIAHDAGFADQSHFTRTFRLATGMTPARYRRTSRSF